MDNLVVQACQACCSCAFQIDQNVLRHVVEWTVSPTPTLFPLGAALYPLQCPTLSWRYPSLSPRYYLHPNRFFYNIGQAVALILPNGFQTAPLKVYLFLRCQLSSSSPVAHNIILPDYVTANFAPAAALFNCMFVPLDSNSMSWCNEAPRRDVEVGGWALRIGYELAPKHVEVFMLNAPKLQVPPIP